MASYHTVRSPPLQENGIFDPTTSNNPSRKDGGPPVPISPSPLGGKLQCSLEQELPLTSAQQPDVKSNWNPVYSLHCHTRPTKTLVGGGNILLWHNACLSWRPQNWQSRYMEHFPVIIVSASHAPPSKNLTISKGKAILYMLHLTHFMCLFSGHQSRNSGTSWKLLLAYNKAHHKSAGLWFILGKYVKLTKSQQNRSPSLW